MTRPITCLFALVLLFSTSAFSQHDKHKAPLEKLSPTDTVKEGLREKRAEEMTMMPEMKSLYSLYLPMNFDGSGSGWQPEENPMAMFSKFSTRTQYSVTGAVFLRYTSQDIFDAGERGDEQFNSANWFMGMVRHQLSERDIISGMAMLSFEPFTIGEGGSPLLLQTGESNNGDPLIDHQHPHDLWMGLGAAYTHSFGRDAEVSATVGYPYEPALGPSAFMHRLSAFLLPEAPLAHHWQDATHIAYGVGTLGLRVRRVKFEGSIFNGREPDENRYDFDNLRLDSYSYRFTWNPVHTLSMQISRGHLESPEELHPEENVTRTTFSVMHTRELPKQTFIASSLVVGVNHGTESPRTRSLLAESVLSLKQLAITARYELVQKDAVELGVRTEPRSVYDSHVFTLGLSRHLNNSGPVTFRVGIQGSYYLLDERLDPVYGEDPFSGVAFLHVMPSFMFH